jgi:cytochrome c-type biogenesis protein CcmH/NrfG
MDVLTTVGRAYAATGETKKAVAALEKVIQTHPFDLNALFILGIAYANNDMNEKALAVFRTVLELNPASPEAKKIVCLLKSRKTVRISLT